MFVKSLQEKDTIHLHELFLENGNGVIYGMTNSQTREGCRVGMISGNLREPKVSNI